MKFFGCFAFWKYFRLDHSLYWLLPGLFFSLDVCIFTYEVGVEFAGRAYAIYGGIYIAASLCWLYFAEQQVPDLWDVIGAGGLHRRRLYYSFYATLTWES